MMDRLYLIASIGGQSIAIRAALVDSVVDIGPISPVPLAAPHIAGLAALRSRVLTTIACDRALGLPPAPRRSSRAVVVEVDGHHYGLLVDTIEDARVIDEAPRPIGIRMAAGWSRVAEGMMDFHGETLLLINPARLIAGDDAIAA
jgi:purine-binding chemotaxis protein CheW